MADEHGVPQLMPGDVLEPAFYPTRLTGLHVIGIEPDSGSATGKVSMGAGRSS